MSSSPTSHDAAALSPTPRTRIRRLSARARLDRKALFDVLDSSLICHLGLMMDGHVVVLPTVFATDSQGPDDGGTLYVHGSVAARSLVIAPDHDICVTCTPVDGLVLARSGFHHSMNYRSAVVIGRGRLVTDKDEKRGALDLIVDHAVPGRARTLRPHTAKELAATSVVALPLREASVKERNGGPVDDPDDVAAGIWAGVLPTQLVAGPLEAAEEAAGIPVPADVLAVAAALR